MRNPRGLVPFWEGLLLLTLLAFRPPPTLAQEAALFQTAQMTEVSLPGGKVRLGRPIQVTESHGRAYIPTIARFSGGGLICSYSLVADTNENPANVRSFQISHDGGRTWGRRYEVLPEHQPMIYVPPTDGSLMAIPAQLYPRRPGQKQDFHAAHIRIEPGGKFILEPGGVQVVDWPWPVEVNQRPAPEANWFVRMAFDGSALRLDDGRLIATGYARKGEESLQRNILFVSGDEGRTWRYYATISAPDILSDPQQPGAGGPSETALIRLQDKDLMAVFRVGNGREWNLRLAPTAVTMAAPGVRWRPFLPTAWSPVCCWPTMARFCSPAAAREFNCGFLPIPGAGSGERSISSSTITAGFRMTPIASFPIRSRTPGE